MSSPDAFFLNTEALDLIVDVEEEAVVARAVVAWSHQEAARSSSHQQVDRLVFAQVPVEPGEDGVGIYGFLEVTEQVLVEQHSCFEIELKISTLKTSPCSPVRCAVTQSHPSPKSLWTKKMSPF